MGLFGLNFGASKGKSKSTTNSSMTKDETTNQQQVTGTFGQTATSQSGTQSSTSSGSSSTTQTGTQAQTGSQASTQTGTTNLFSDDVLSSLGTAVQGLLGNLGGTNPAVAGSQAFNVDDYVKNATLAAKQNESDTLDQVRGGLSDMIGGKLGNSSMGTLLAQKAQTAADADVAGVTASAASTGAQIANAQSQTALAGQAQDTNLLNTILTALKGGSQSTTAAANQTNTSNTTTGATQNTNTNESTNTANQSTSLQTISQLVDALLSGTTHTTGTENSTTKGSTTNFNGGLKIG